MSAYGRTLPQRHCPPAPTGMLMPWRITVVTAGLYAEELFKGENEAAAKAKYIELAAAWRGNGSRVALISPIGQILESFK